jgi:hypothetical protein
MEAAAEEEQMLKQHLQHYLKGGMGGYVMPGFCFVCCIGSTSRR